MSKKQWGSFPDAWGEDDSYTGGKLAKAVDKDDVDLNGLCAALEKLNKRAATMSPSQLTRLNFKLGFAVNRFKKAVHDYINQPRKSMNQGSLEKVHKGNGDMDDAGIGGERIIILPEKRGAGNKFVKARTGDMSDSGID